MSMNRRHSLLALASAAAVLSLGGCATLSQISVDAQSFGSWPSGRSPGRYAFDRLPSQQNPDSNQQALEQAASVALERAGFKPVADAKEADVLVSVGARVSRTDPAPWDDPLWWRGRSSYYEWRRGYWQPYYPRRTPYGWDPMLDSRYERSVALLLRDRTTSEPLYEARASSDGFNPGDSELLRTLLVAALSDFPRTRPDVHRVRLPLVAAPAQP
ncbi:DUF4136 domain-containing protein [Roseateles sp. BYS180W]|uniref:DUF4136 domain-containing protein n=1 Tax=Roseateles rivi TaxID=3299028 RepID=A0ABW7FRD0_9BURK